VKFSIIYSKKDEAGVNIAQELKNHFLPQVQIIELAKDTIYAEEIDEKEEALKNSEFIIFATRHQSKETRKTLSLHAPGNWRNADYGGKPGKICSTSALALKFLYQKLEENAKAVNSDYELTLEATHHGPLINKPCCFIEIGPSSEQWKDKNAAKIIAKTIADFQNFKKDSSIKSALAIGGPHYCSNFNKIQVSTESQIAIGHVIPSYILPVNESMLKEVLEKTKEHLDLIILDWKGCGNSESRENLLQLIEKMGLIWKRSNAI
jgi:D-aminoacyl-tRNA deacylase